MAESGIDTDSLGTRSRGKVTDDINLNDQSDSKVDTQTGQSEGKWKRKTNSSQSNSGEPAAKNLRSQPEGRQIRTDNSTLSNILPKVLDKVGANEWTRKKHYEHTKLLCMEIVFHHLSEDGKIDIVPAYIYNEVFGSMVEGTTTCDMGSDFDQIAVMSNTVVEKDSGNKDVAHKGIFVIVADMFTPPGYVKIKALQNICSTFAFRQEDVVDGTIFMSNDYSNLCTNLAMIMFKSSLTRHGPALTSKIYRNSASGDFLLALHCKSVFSFNKGFFHRTRQYGWPSQATLAIMKSQACLLVPIGHIHCEKKYKRLQWRISFSFQERQLMFNLNSAQYKCYILLKLIKKYHISPIVDLTSYHCKTALFYTIENTPSEIWSEDNLLNCYILCLKRLKRWTMRHFCPNYFIPELNLFAGKIQEQDMYKLADKLSSLIKYPPDYIKLIPGLFGKTLQLYDSGVENVEEELEKNVNHCQFVFQGRTVLSLLRIRNTLLHKISYKCDDINKIIIRHYKWLNTINTYQNSNSFGPYTLDGVQWALPHVCRFLHSSLASHLAIKATETENTVMKSWLSISAAYHFWVGLNSDAMSGKLKFATILLYNGNLNIETFQSSFRPSSATELQLSHCGCRSEDHSASTNSCFKALLISKQSRRSFRLELSELTASQYIEKYLSASTIFLPSERKITPYPLQLNNFACLDSKVYSILLSIYTSGRQAKERHMKQLRECFTSDNSTHKQTTLNIMQWLERA